MLEVFGNQKVKMLQMEPAECRFCGAEVAEYKLLTSDSTELMQRIRQTYSLVVSVVQWMPMRLRRIHLTSTATR